MQPKEFPLLTLLKPDTFLRRQCPVTGSTLIQELKCTAILARTQQVTCFFIYLKIFIYLFIYFWLSWVFVAACGLPLVAASRGYSSLRCAGFSLQWLLLLRSTGSRRVGVSS